METVEKEDVYRIAREVVRQEIEAVLPIHSEIVDLKSAVRELAQAQSKTEARLEELAQAQAKTEARLEELAQAQAKTEARLEELAQAQAKTEARLEELAQAQAKTEARLEELAQAQAKTEEELRSLTAVVKDMQKEMRSMSQQIGGLAHAVGFQLEDRAYASLPKLLELDFGIKLKERLLRKFITTKKGETLEINIIGKGEKDGKEVYVVGEAKANLSTRHIVDFIDRLNDIKETLQTEIIPVMVTYMSEPEVEEFAKSKGIRVYYSYEFQPIL
ncbi:MAG TPA: hypothetical protein PK512_00840 [bacterium]|nr:hypothetical protein [bacterium]HRR91683.1 hypothetical protein [bacterium]